MLCCSLAPSNPHVATTTSSASRARFVISQPFARKYERSHAVSISFRGQPLANAMHTFLEIPSFRSEINSVAVPLSPP